LVYDDFSLTNKRYANVCGHLHHRLAMQQCAELPLESFDHSPGSDMVLSNLNL
jgi:hypothetical protein